MRFYVNWLYLVTTTEKKKKSHIDFFSCMVPFNFRISISFQSCHSSNKDDNVLLASTPHNTFIYNSNNIITPNKVTAVFYPPPIEQPAINDFAKFSARQPTQILLISNIWMYAGIDDFGEVATKRCSQIQSVCVIKKS